MDKKDIIAYLKMRGLQKARPIFELLTEQEAANNYSLFTVNKYDYMISHYLTCSGQVGYGIIPTNDILNTERINALAIALVEGDDVVCINLEDNSIFLWLIQSGCGEHITVANNLKEFIAITKGQI